MKRILFSLAALVMMLPALAQKAEKATPLTQEEFLNQALTPPMGWNSWNCFHCNVSEEMLMGMADAMVSSGMKDVGYEYIVVDDCWQVDRDADGWIVCDPERFPHGIKYVADYIHSKGLKFGIYSCVGDKTCAGRPGSQGHEFQDALFYARSGVDYLKYDFCHKNQANSWNAYHTMREALKAAGRPIVFSICEWGSTKPWEWATGIGHLWRTTGDIGEFWVRGDRKDGRLGVLDIIDLNKDLYPFAGPGHWNDPDMLEVGNGDLTYDENVAHFTMWCMLAAPLMSGNDLRSMPDEIHSILTNKEAIAVNQDSLGVQGHVSVDMGDKQVWVKKLSNDEWAVCFFNRSEKAWDLNYNMMDIHELDGGLYDIRDLWAHKNIGKTDRNVIATIPSHGVLMTRLTPTTVKSKGKRK
jgi:alpha-galactosidase